MASFEEYEKSKRSQLQKGNVPSTPVQQAPDIIVADDVGSPNRGGNEDANLPEPEVKSYKKADLSPNLGRGIPDETDYEKYLPDNIREAAKVTNLPLKDPLSKTRPTRGIFKGVVVRDEKKSEDKDQ